jgi:uncharacterized membrane protein YphA (DoxX/SURF4 family)
VTLLIQGGSYIGAPNPAPAAWAVGILALCAGGLLVLGFLTPIVGALVGLGACGVALSLLPGCTPNLLESKPALVFAWTMLLALIGLGPGRFSVDARLFGRREIMIPPPVTRPEQ